MFNETDKDQHLKLSSTHFIGQFMSSGVPGCSHFPRTGAGIVIGGGGINLYLR